MTLHRQTAELLAGLAALGLPPIEEMTPEDAREQRRAMLRPSPEPIAEVRDVDAGGVPCRLYRPAVTRSAGLLLWCHGGGWVLGDLESHDDLCRVIANRGGFAVLSVGYRLAPEHPYPAAVDDAVTAAAWAHDHAAELGCAPLLAVGGDSAGGNLAAVLANRPVVPVCFQALVYPCTDARMGHHSYVENATGYSLTPSGMRWFYDHYLSGDDGSHDDPRVSPLLEDEARIASAPSALVVTAEYDPLRDEGVAYAERLAEAGVATTHVHFGGQIHGFFSMFGL
ncbi:MAG TPA: alpha/beta hydrolase, partial [Ilumatobacteraceae bacterium]|nr:alpha/beta hydrolase [Ilumatobacteraceae bacterium]